MKLRHVFIIVVCLLVAAGAYAADNAGNLSESKNFPKTLKHIQNDYVEPERIDLKEMLNGALDDIQRTIPEILIKFQSPTLFSVTINNAEKKFSSPLGDMDEFWKLMKDVFVFIELNYKGDVKLKDIEAIAINGALRMLDPHSAFLTPEYYKEFKIDTGGEFGGLGIVITSKDGQLTVIAPIEDTPAWKAGLRSGDIITEIDDESTVNMSLMKAVEKLRGKIGSKVAITVERKGRNAPFQLTMTRANIHIESIKDTLIKDAEGSAGYIKIKRFQTETAQNFIKALKDLQTESGSSFRGLIVDLRNNPGGLLDQAVKIADVFLPGGTIVSTVGANKMFIDEDTASLPGTEPNTYPVIVLVNEGSASASEIVAGALQSYGRALIIGQRTFGKGSVQSVFGLGNDYALKLTIAQYLTAGKNSIQTVGIGPDITVSPVTVDKEYTDIIPNKQSSEMELEKHLEQLRPTPEKEKNVISFYKQYIDESKIEEMRQKEYADTMDFRDDFAVKLATRIIMAAKASDPKLILSQSAPVVGDLEKQEEQKISSKLGDLGTSWDAGRQGPVNMSTASSVRENNKPVARATAGNDIQLALSVTNGGKDTLYKLIGVTESDNPLLDEREFVLGKILPGQTVTKEVAIKLPQGMSDINIPYKVAFRQGDKQIAYKYSSVLGISKREGPAFAFSYEFEKPRTVGAPHPLPRGKGVPLTVRIKNAGAGASNDAHAYISNKNNEEGLFIETGRAELGVIKSGETKTANFSIRVQPQMDSSAFTLELMISDKDFFEFVSADLEVTVESGTINPQPGIWYKGPEIKVAEKSFPIVTNADNYILSGKITDDVAIKDYYIFVNDKKAAYQANPKETNQFDFRESLMLESGNNNVTIVARDNNKLEGRKSFVIQKGHFK